MTRRVSKEDTLDITLICEELVDRIKAGNKSLSTVFGLEVRK
jgi:hypothetical protein